MYKQIKPLPTEGKMKVDNKEQSLKLQDVLLNGDNPMSGNHFFFCWNKTNLWAYTFEKDFDKAKEPLHTFTDYFTPTN